MNRREFLARSAGAAMLAFAGPLARGALYAVPVQIRMDASRPLKLIPDNFLGLGYEISSVAIPGLLSPRNHTYVRLVRQLSKSGVIRIGGNTADFASFDRAAQAVSQPKGTVVNFAQLLELGGFLEATGWQLIWGLNLGNGDVSQAVAEAQAVSAAVKDKLLAFEIGNEPDLFGRGTGHRPRDYDYAAFLKEYRRYKSAVRQALPHAPFAGPDVASATSWVPSFMKDEGRDLKLLTHHYYRECAGPASTLDMLLHPDPKLPAILSALRASSTAPQLPFRICETNSFCGGGKPGVSDTLGAALWVLDFLFALATAGCAGVNMETGVNQLGFVSSYSPISNVGSGAVSAKPEYFGMLAFAQAGRGRQIAVECDANGVNLTAYAVQNERSGLTVTIVNKDATKSADVTIAGDNLPRGSALRLTGPSLDSKEGVALGGAERVRSIGGKLEIHVPAASAAIVRS